MITGQFRQTVAAQEAHRTWQRLEALDNRLGESLSENAQTDRRDNRRHQARLTVIDEAQKNITALSGHVVSLQSDLFRQAGARRLRPGPDGRDRRRRSAARPIRIPIHAIQRNSRPDCVIRIPNVKGAIVIDSKFPLEAFEVLRDADNEDASKAPRPRCAATSEACEGHRREIPHPR